MDQRNLKHDFKSRKNIKHTVQANKNVQNQYVTV